MQCGIKDGFATNRPLCCRSRLMGGGIRGISVHFREIGSPYCFEIPDRTSNLSTKVPI
jgi:hypothetical protein